MMKIRRLFCYSRLVSAAFFSWLITTSLSQAQVTSDRILSTNVATADNLNYSIDGGARAGSNLFHSFEEFSIPTGGSAVFTNAEDIENIFSRVTGSNISSIDGRLQAQGNASLFLINPNGIIFGPEASLNIGGSFVASTANGIQFADGTFSVQLLSKHHPS